MKKSYRIAVEKIYHQALATVGIEVEKVTAHRDASATVPVWTDEDVAQVVALPEVEVLAQGNTSITIRIPAAVAYHQDNAPLWTEEERQAMAEEKARAKAERAARKAAAAKAKQEKGS